MINYDEVGKYNELSDAIELNVDPKMKLIQIKERYTIERNRWADPCETSVILFDDEIETLRNILNRCYKEEK